MLGIVKAIVKTVLDEVAGHKYQVSVKVDRVEGIVVSAIVDPEPDQLCLPAAEAEENP